MSALKMAMCSPMGEPLLLEKVSVRGSVHATLARVTMRQEYRNDTDRNLEAIYTFPLPPAAVLLRTVVELNGKRYEGVVLPKTEAEEKYDDAIAEGNTAIMVERPEPGFYTMNLGNLMAGECAVVEIEFAQLLDWSHRRMRLALPMTIAPRYGEERGKLEPHARPPVDPLAERPFSLELRIDAAASVSSPTHAIATRMEGGSLVVALAREAAWMDRDFVLLLEASRRPEPFAVVTSSGDAKVGYVSFQIPEASEDPRGRDVRIVIDCSGSMGGESIALARRGALNLLNRLREVDRFGIVAFGSTTKSFRAGVVEATDAHIEDAIAWVQALEADMGGTELATALENAMELRARARGPADIFLVTDGQVGESDRTVDQALKLGLRVFVVGIGVSPSRGLLEQVAGATHGAVDWIAPGEDAAEAIGRQFARVTQVPVSDLSVDWGVEVRSDWCAGVSTRRFYSGDTIHAFCDLDNSPRSAKVRYCVEGKSITSFEVPCAMTPEELAGSVVHRLAAERRIAEGLSARSMDERAAEALAVEHELITRLTNYVLVVDRGEARAVGVPVTTPVRHMLAAGWGGAGKAHALRSAFSVDMLCLDSAVAYARKAPMLGERAAKPHEFLETANDRFGSLLMGRVLPLSLPPIRSMGLPSSIGEFLQQLIDDGHSEDAVIRAFWAAFALFLDPSQTKRGLARKLKAVSASADARLVSRILAELRGLEITS